MAKHWPVVPLREVVRHRAAFIEIDDATRYKRCRVQTGAKGVVLRDVVAGSDVRTKRQQVCKKNDFIVAEIDAKVGGYGLVNEFLANSIVSSHYFLYEVDEFNCTPNFLDWFSKTSLFQNQIFAQGSTNYAAIRPSHVLDYRIPLPSLEEQRRIVARLDQVERWLKDRHTALDAMEAETNAMLRSAFDQIIDGAPMRPMAEIAPLVRRPVTVSPEESYPELGVRSFGRGTFHKPSLPGAEVGTKKLFSILPSDLVFNIVFAWEGAVAVAKKDDEGRVGSHRFLTCVPEQSKATAEFLRFYFLTPQGLTKLGDASPGGAGRNRTLGLKALEAIQVPVPRFDKQLWFDRLQGKVQEMRLIHEQAARDAEALLPAMLHEIFGDTEV